MTKKEQKSFKSRLSVLKTWYITQKRTDLSTHRAESYIWGRIQQKSGTGSLCPPSGTSMMITTTTPAIPMLPGQKPEQVEGNHSPENLLGETGTGWKNIMTERGITCIFTAPSKWRMPLTCSKMALDSSTFWLEARLTSAPSCSCQHWPLGLKSYEWNGNGAGSRPVCLWKWSRSLSKTEKFFIWTQTTCLGLICCTHFG